MWPVGLLIARQTGFPDRDLWPHNIRIRAVSEYPVSLLETGFSGTFQLRDEPSPEAYGQCAKMRNRMKFIVSLYRDEDGTYIAECPSIPGCVSQGQTETEAESNITDAIRECLAVRAELGMPPTVTTREVEVVV